LFVRKDEDNDGSSSSLVSLKHTFAFPPQASSHQIHAACISSFTIRRSVWLQDFNFCN